MSQPQRSYQRPAPPPLYPLRNDGPTQIDQPQGRSPNQPSNGGEGKSKLKWVLIAAGVFACAIILAVLTMGGGQQGQSVSPNPYKP